MQAPLNRSLSVHAFEIFKTVREAKLFCDAVLRTEDDGRFHVHKCIMISCSPYFLTLFDRRPRAKDTFTVYGVSKHVLGKIIDYAYFRKADFTMDNVVDILVAAIKLEITGLQQDCGSYLGDNLSIENCLSVRKLAQRFHLTNLTTKSQEFLMRNFGEICFRNKEVMELLPLELASILLCEELNVRNEEFLWETVLCWINFDSRNRKRYISYFIKCIRFGLMDEEYFTERVKNHPLVIKNYESSEEFKETFDNILDILNNFNKQHSFETIFTCPRTPHEVLFVIGGWSNGNTTNTIETYDSRTDCWLKGTYADPAGPRSYHGSVVLQNKIYIIGGHDGEEFLNSCRCFCTITKQWTDIGPMHCKRCYVSTAVNQDFIYAMGGYDGTHHQSTVEKYDSTINQWTFVASMNVRRSDSSAAPLNGKLYVTGGFDGGESLRSVEEYNPCTNQWTMIQPMIEQRSRMSSITYKDCLFVLGGYDDGLCLKTVEKYDPTYHQWSYSVDMPFRRRDFASGVIDDMIFIVGGYGEDSVTDKVEYYDPSSNSWFEASELNIARTGLSACVVGHIPNIRDYVCKRSKQLG